MAQTMNLDNKTAAELMFKLERLSKSFAAAGYPDANRGGRTGINALAIESVDPIMRSICSKEEHMHMIKDIKKENSKASVFQYRIQNAVATQGRDLAIFENGLPQEDQANWETVSEVLKIYGIKTTFGDMVRLINDQDSYSIDVEKANEENAITALSQQYERDSYAGGDYYIDANGDIDVETPLKFNTKGPAAIRHARGIQNNVREGDRATRGISLDYIAYGNSYSVVFDNKGAGLDQDILDDISTAVSANGGNLTEAHVQPAQAAEFRKSLYAIQRGDISSKFAVEGPDVQGNWQGGGFSVLTACGPIKFIPCLYKHAVRQRALPIAGSSGAAPVPPTAVMDAPIAKDTPFKVGDQIKFIVQAANIHGMSMGTQIATYTILADGDAPVVKITNSVDAEYYLVFATPVETKGKMGTEGFIGYILKNRSGAFTSFVASGTILPGIESVVFMGSEEDRLKMAVLGNLINKSELGRNGLAMEHVYSSYFCFVLYKPRSCALLDNVKARRRVYRN